MAIAVDNDGVPSEDYDSGNRFAISAGFIVVTVVLSVAAVVCCTAMARRTRSTPVSQFFAGLTPSLLALALVPLWWNR